MAWLLQAGPPGPGPPHLQLSLSVRVTDLLQHVAAAAATRCGLATRPPARRPLPRTAWTAARPLPLRSHCQPAGWPCALLPPALPARRLALRLRDGSRGPPGPHPFPILLHCSDPSWSFGIQFTPPGGLTGGLESHSSWSFQGFVSAQRADSQRSCADPAPSCWTARLGGVGPQPTGRRVNTDVPRSQ